MRGALSWLRSHAVNRQGRQERQEKKEKPSISFIPWRSWRPWRLQIFLLLGGDRLGQGLDHAGHDVSIHQFLANAPLVAVRFAISLVGLASPVLADREINADRRLGKLAGAHLVGSRAGLDRQPALK